MKKILVFLLVALSLPVVFAQSIAATASGALPWVMVPVSGGIALQTTSSAVLFPAAADTGKAAFAALLDGRVYISGRAETKFVGTLPFMADVAATVEKASVAGAMGRFALKGLPVLGTGIALYDMAQELNILLSKKPDGSTQYQRTLSGVEYQVPGYGPWSASAQAACSAAALASFGGIGTLGNNSTFCYMYRANGNYGNGIGISSRSSAPSVVEITNQEFVDAVAAKSGWPSSSALAKATAAAIAAGVVVDVIPRMVSGPTSLPGDKVVTVDPTTGTTTTKDTSKLISYLPSPNFSPSPVGSPVPSPGSPPAEPGTGSGPTISPTDKTTTGTTSGGPINPASAPTTTTTPGSPDSVSDTPLPSLPPLYVAKYPDGMTGVWDAQKAALNATPFAGLTAQLMPSMPSTGNCPSWMLDLHIGPWDHGSYDVAPPCWIWGVAKAIVILSALLLARALIFGG